jgi:hypothetical protein
MYANSLRDTSDEEDLFNEEKSAGCATRNLHGMHIALRVVGSPGAELRDRVLSLTISPLTYIHKYVTLCKKNFNLRLTSTRPRPDSFMA